ncbi:MAG: SDR family NAD(P)-dependent oxidoreductase [Chitinophagaceae bacterium]|nr:MAG: SDR family NAD(P)-dependent oxidoreductase [Chitinophagaceae bacterium]
MKNILIITGGSKGIGKGIVEAYQAKGYQIVSIARTRGDFTNTNALLEYQADLSDEKVASHILPAIFEKLHPERIERIVLINNAGTLGGIGRIENLNSENISSAVKLNTIAPLILTSAFIALTNDWTCEKKVINISSGAAQNPYYGWSVYCATKAALDMMTKVVAAEQNAIKHGVKIIAIYPGVVDTDMQTEIRSHKKEDFNAIDRFLELKASGSLLDPQYVGEAIYRLDQQELENGSILRVE